MWEIELRYYVGMTNPERQEISPTRQNGDLWSALAKRHPQGALLPPHQHRAGQLIFATSGVMQVKTGQGHWTVPPQRALWVPPQHPHAIQMFSDTEMRTVYVQPALIGQCTGFARHRQVHALVASPLIKELVFGLFDTRRSHDMRELMAGLLLHALGEAATLPTYLPMPSEARLRTALTELMASNNWLLPMDEVASRAAMSGRTFTRRFSAEVGLSFRQWRQRARIVASLDLLAAHRATKFVAHAMGFASSAAYVAAFREVLGATPGTFR
ncbi:helix-turn-helix transcriptional regulator [Janthinobacterium sp.]|uniref:AraC family transcriptional regulator n=1 Tax=Janthinobacterium sp. TaxID=1871054 RepID=UPI00293D50E2|nr:helix-turn-helix transcriptional regulator [Janthinobacterium sp.]